MCFAGALTNNVVSDLASHGATLSARMVREGPGCHAPPVPPRPSSRPLARAPPRPNPDPTPDWRETSVSYLRVCRTGRRDGDSGGTGPPANPHPADVITARQQRRRGGAAGLLWSRLHNTAADGEPRGRHRNKLISRKYPLLALYSELILNICTMSTNIRGVYNILFFSACSGF